MMDPLGCHDAMVAASPDGCSDEDGESWDNNGLLCYQR